MSLLVRIASALLLAGALHTLALAHDEAVPIRVQVLVPFASAEGLDRLARATAKSDFAPLANQFEAQATIAFCGPTSAAIVLNALHPQDMEAPRDRSRLHTADAQYLPKSLELTVPRYTQASVSPWGKRREPRSSENPRPSTARCYVMAATSYANSTKCSKRTS